MNAAITSVYNVIAVCTPWIVVSRSSTICEIATFITLVSSTITNWAEARISIGIHLRTEDGPYVGGQRRACPSWAKFPSLTRRGPVMPGPSGCDSESGHRGRARQRAGAGGAAPAAYSCIGTSPAAHAAITGSIMRQASSASSPRMNSIGLPWSISSIRWA